MIKMMIMVMMIIMKMITVVKMIPACAVRQLVCSDPLPLQRP